MYIKSSEYLSKFTGKQIDDAIENMRDYEAELALKVDKTTEINGHDLSDNIDLTAQDVGALSDTVQVASSLAYENGYLNLLDSNEVVLSSEFIYPSWGDIQGDDLSTNEVLQNALDEKQDVITSESMLSSDLVDDSDKAHKFATASQLAQIATNATDISGIDSKIPSQATAENQLADKNFVNSSIATNTAYFIGTFQSVEDLEAYSGTLTNNDYAFVETVDSAGNTLYKRYKYNSQTEEWAFEYELNNSSFTADQWATITSGLSASDKTQIATNTSAITSINTILDAHTTAIASNTSAIELNTTAIASNTSSIQALDTALAGKSSVTFVDWTTE